MCIEQFVPALRGKNREQLFKNRRQGFENFFSYIAVSEGFAVNLFCMTDTENYKRILHKDGYIIELVPHSLRCFNLKYPYEFSMPLLVRLNKQLIKGYVDIVHFHEYYSPMFFFYCSCLSN